MLINYFKSKKRTYDEALAEGIKKGTDDERRRNNNKIRVFKKEVNEQISKKNKKIFSMRKRVNQIENMVKVLTPIIMRTEDKIIQMEGSDILTYQKISTENNNEFQRRQKLCNESLAVFRYVKNKLPSLELQVEKFKIEDAGE